MMLVSAFVLVLFGTAPTNAHDWTPGDGGWGEVTTGRTANCDNPGSTGWQLNDGRVCWQVKYYDHGGHLHIDHLRGIQWANPYDKSDELYAVRNIDIRVFKGYCSSNFPKCKNDGEVTGPVWSGSMTNLENSGQAYFRSIEHKVGDNKALVVVDHVPVGFSWFLGTTTGWTAQEEIKIG